MLFAPRFTYIHEPKTGGTFVSHVVGRLHGTVVDVPASRLRAPALRFGLAAASFYPELVRARVTGPRSAADKYGRVYRWNDHGTCSEIPAGRRSRPILATVRNPLETYVSLFRFGWWQRPEYIPVYRRFIPDFDSRYPTFPDVSFRQYLELLHSGCVLPASRDVDDPTAVGYLTQRFVRFYFRLGRGARGYDPAPVLRNIDGYLAGGRYEEGIFDVRFIRTARLNRDLCEFLIAVGYEAADVQFVEDLAPVIPTGTSFVFGEGSDSSEWTRYYTPELEATMRSRDRLIFTLFPDIASGAAPPSATA
jgi:hypothetical protein